MAVRCYSVMSVRVMLIDVAVQQSVSSTATAEHVVSGSEMLLSNVSQSDVD